MNRGQLPGSADIMYIHMQVSFVVTSLGAHCLSRVYFILMCVGNTSDNNMYLFKNVEFVLSDDPNKRRSWK